MNQSDWGRIKGGFSGFEELAYQFVKDNYQAPNKWNKTLQTRDGNRDAFTIVFGYNPYPAKEEQWWMEAKYSTKEERLSRYRLDATIVSAVLEGNISKIIFVTNIVISTKTILDIRNALKYAANCKEVHFCTKYTLEYWLSQRKDIIKEFFEYSEPLRFLFPELFVTEEIEFFSEIGSRIAFREPLQILSRRHKYCAFFTVFSTKERSLTIRPITKGVSVLSPSSLSIHKGENSLRFLFELHSDCCTGNDNQRNNAPIFKLGSCDLIPKYAMNIIEPATQHIEFRMQNKIIESMKNDMLHFQKKQTPNIFCIKGHSGMGKSYILDQVAENLSIENEDLFYVNFSDSPIDNNKLLVNAALFIMFPYVGPKDIDVAYLNRIKQTNYISSLLFDIVDKQDSLDDLYRVFSNIQGDEALFPVSMSIGKRFILLDNLQKLSQQQAGFLVAMVVNIWKGNFPLFFVLSSQPQFFDQHFQLIRERITFKECECELDEEDMFQYLQHSSINTLDFIRGSLRGVFPNLLELFCFSQYLYDIKEEVTGIDDFLLACKSFYKTQMAEQYILKQFNNIFSLNSNIRSLCDAIYWSENGISLPYHALKEIQLATQLLELNLICYSENDLLIPYHEIYQKYYRAHFPQPAQLDYAPYTPRQELKYTLENQSSHDVLTKAVEMIRTLNKDDKFHTVFYLLENMFVNQNKKLLKSRLGEDIFYDLYMCFALSSTNVSTTNSGRELFEKISSETMASGNPDVLEICESATWELVNSLYEWLDFDGAQKQIDFLVDIIKRLQRYGRRDSNIKKCIHYHDALVIQTLIDSDLNKPDVDRKFDQYCREIKENGFEYRYQTFCVRYGLTLLLRNMGFAFTIIQKSDDYLITLKCGEDKNHLSASLILHYICMIQQNSYMELQEVLNIHNKMKRHFFNDYRKKNIAIASFYYCNGEFGLGNKYLFQEANIERDMRPRQKAFYYETVALYEYLSGRDQHAMDALNKASDIFKDCPEYHKIVCHNKKLINEGAENRRACFCCVDQLEKGIFYVDPRCVW